VAAAPTATPEPTPTLVPTAAAVLSGMRIAIDVDPDTLDPAGQTNATVQSVVDYVTEPLVRLQADGSLAPGLAERWDRSPDGRVYTFQLRQGVRFHDRAVLDAEAVKLSLERFLNPQLKVPLRAPFDANLVEAVVAVDPSTLRIQLRDSFRLFLHKLAGTEMGIVSPAHAHAYPDTYNEEPAGTGPYRFKERRRGESVVLERFDNYWGRKPYYPQVQFRIVPEVATRESLLLANQVEMIIQPPLSDLPSLQRSGNLRVLLGPTSRTTFVAMDLTLPGGTPLSIKKVRQALNYAIDREGLIRSLLFGAAVPMDAPMAPSLAGYTRTGPYSYDPGRARQLLTEGGTPQLLLKFIHPTGRSTQDSLAAQVAQGVASNLHEVGVTTELTGYDWPSYLAAISVPEDRGIAHMHLFGWAPAFPDASQQLLQFTRNQWPPQGLATTHYTNPRVESLLEQSNTEPDDRKRQDLYAEAQRLIWDDAPWIFLWVPSFPLAYTARIANVTTTPSEKFSAMYAEPA
jgi:peptide/nickel transport system substrate-binding protein